MGRCKKERCCRKVDGLNLYKPAGLPLSVSGVVTIPEDEFEALRLCYYEGKSQIEAAELMKISRGTLQRILNAGRVKLVGAILNKKAFKIK